MLNKCPECFKDIFTNRQADHLMRQCEMNTGDIGICTRCMTVMDITKTSSGYEYSKFIPATAEEAIVAESLKEFAMRFKKKTTALSN